MSHREPRYFADLAAVCDALENTADPRLWKDLDPCTAERRHCWIRHLIAAVGEAIAGLNITLEQGRHLLHANLGNAVAAELCTITPPPIDGMEGRPLHPLCPLNAGAIQTFARSVRHQSASLIPPFSSIPRIGDRLREPIVLPMDHGICGTR